MELRQLKYFIAIANSKSYSTAAKSLFVTQPTLSWNIQKLEEELNDKLFFQSNNSLKLTDSGELLFEEGQKILTNLEEVVEKIQKRSRQTNQTLKVGLTVLFAIQYMEQIMNFTSSNPDVDVTFVQRGSIELQKMLANKEIDVGLLSFPIYEPTINIESLKTSHGDYSVSVVMPYNHELAHKKSIKIPDLKGFKISSFSSNYVLGKVLRDRCQEFGFHPNIMFTNDNWEVLLQNAALNTGITIMPRSLEKISNFVNLKWIPLDDKANFFEIGVAKRKNDKLSDPAIKFIDHLKDN